MENKCQHAIMLTLENDSLRNNENDDWQNVLRLDLKIACKVKVYQACKPWQVKNPRQGWSRGGSTGPLQHYLLI